MTDTPEVSGIPIPPIQTTPPQIIPAVQPLPPRQCKNFIDTYIRACQFSEAPALFHKWSAIAVVSAAMQRKIWIDWGLGDGVFANLYICFVGHSGQGKDTAFQEAQALIRTNSLIRIGPSTATREAFFLQMCDPSGTVSGAEITATEPVHTSVTILHPELAAFLSPKDGTLQFRQELAELWDCPKDMAYATIKRGTVYVQNAYLTIFGCMTPGMIRQVLPRESGEEGGLTSRIVWVYADEPACGVPFPALRNSLRPLHDALRNDLHIISRLRGQFSFYPDFVYGYQEWYKKGYTEQDEACLMIPGWHSRRRIHVLKLSMIHAVSRWTQDPSNLILAEEDLQWAIDTLGEVSGRMAHCFETSHFGPVASLKIDIIMFLRHRPDYKATFEEVVNNFFQHDFHIMRLAVAGLMAGGHVKMLVNGANPNNPIYQATDAAIVMLNRARARVRHSRMLTLDMFENLTGKGYREGLRVVDPPKQGLLPGHRKPTF